MGKAILSSPSDSVDIVVAKADKVMYLQVCMNLYLKYKDAADFLKLSKAFWSGRKIMPRKRQHQMAASIFIRDQKGHPSNIMRTSIVCMFPANLTHCILNSEKDT